MQCFEAGTVVALCSVSFLVGLGVSAVVRYVVRPGSGFIQE